MASRARQLGLVLDGSPWYQVFHFSLSSRRLCLHIICIHLHVVLQGPAEHGENTFFSPGCLPAWIRARCAETRPIKFFPHLALHPPLGRPFLHLPAPPSPPVELGPQVSSQGEGPSQDLAFSNLLCELTSHFSSQCLNLPLYELRVYRRSGSGGCVPEEVSLY